MSELLAARALRVAVPNRVLVESFDCVVRGGEFIALLGSNGAGKSLLLRTLAGLRVASGGSVQLDGQALDSMPRRAIARRMGFLPQDPDAPPQGSLFESVLLGRHAHLGFWEGNGEDDERRAAHALAEVGLDSMRGRELATLSGGEQRRAAIARRGIESRGRPSSWTEPPLAGRSPASVRSSSDFPAPLLPSNAMNSPARTAQSKDSTSTRFGTAMRRPRVASRAFTRAPSGFRARWRRRPPPRRGRPAFRRCAHPPRSGPP
jgi:ABC-type transport system involved in cytochrome c biogenesis ATPase subunit